MKERVPLEGGGLPSTHMQQAKKAQVQGSQVSGSSQPLGGSRGVASRCFKGRRELLRRGASPYSSLSNIPRVSKSRQCP